MVFSGPKTTKNNTKVDTELQEIFKKCVEQLKSDRPKIHGVDTYTAMRAAKKVA
jgi:hypothetical protein